MAVRPILTTGIALVSAGVIAAVPVLNPSVLSPRDQQVVADVETSLAAAYTYTPDEEPLTVGNLQSALAIIGQLGGQPQLGGLAAGSYADELQIVGDAFARGGIDEVARIASGEVGDMVFETTDETGGDENGNGGENGNGDNGDGDNGDGDNGDGDNGDGDNGDGDEPAPEPGLQDIASMFLELYMNGGITAVAGYASLMLAAFIDPITPIPGDLMEIFFFGAQFVDEGPYYQQGFVGIVHYAIDTILTGGFSFPDFGLPDFGIPGLPFGSSQAQLLKVGAVETADEEEGASADASVGDAADPGSAFGIFDRVADRFGLPTSQDSEDVAEDDKATEEAVDEEIAEDETADEQIAEDEAADEKVAEDEAAEDETVPEEAVDESAGEGLIDDTETTDGTEGGSGNQGVADTDTERLADVELEKKPRLGVSRLSDRFSPGSTTPGSSLPRVGSGLNKALEGLTEPDDSTQGADDESNGSTATGSKATTDKSDGGDSSDSSDSAGGSDDD